VAPIAGRSLRADVDGVEGRGEAWDVEIMPTIQSLVPSSSATRQIILKRR